MIIEFIHSTIHNSHFSTKTDLLVSEFKVIILFGYIIDVSWYGNTFLNIQAQTIKEVRDEEKWSSIFLYI